MNKKQDPRTEFIIVRVSKTEKGKLLLAGGSRFSEYIRKLLGL